MPNVTTTSCNYTRSCLIIKIYILKKNYLRKRSCSSLGVNDLKFLIVINVTQQQQQQQ